MAPYPVAAVRGNVAKGCWPFGPKYTISGYAYDADGTTAVSGATIAFGALSTTSAGDGSYTLAAVPKGSSGSMTCTLTGYSWTAITVAAMSGNLVAQNFTAKFWNGGALKAWFDFSDISTLFQDAAGTTPVTADAQSIRNVTDKSGNSNKLTNAGAAGTVPVYKTGIQNSLGAVLADGGNNLVTAAFGAELAVPNTIIFAVSNPAVANNEIPVDGISGTKRHCVWWSNPNLAIYSGTGRISTNTTAGASVLSAVFGNNSILRRNGASLLTAGNSGNQALSGITLLNDSSLSYGLNGYMLEYILYAGAIEATAIGYTESYLLAKWAII